ncbi:MAG: hypothetical protein ACRDZ8_18040 [Acidimicrobiales bacterium]
MAPPPPAFDARHVSPPDAVVTLRSLRRRFAEAFEHAEAPEQVTTAAPSGISPLDRAARVAGALQQIGDALRQVFVADDPTVQLPTAPARGATGGAVGNPNTVLERLGQQAQEVADIMSGVHGDDWARTGRDQGRSVSALDIARLGVAIAIDELKAAESDLGVDHG